ncbi:AAA family ATPase [Paenibacillus sanguinis]|uniref:AAA family ATPase n=1 Tax=Paenibacillus sanguinis TaxID=225906 RepID=UPI00035EE7C9|nr:AAA family ATPase [Paenibacillus sanguinis]
MTAVAELYTLNKSVVVKVREYMESTGTTITEIAREIGFSRPALSQYLSGNYKVENSDIEEKVAAYMAAKTGETELASTRESSLPSKPTFFESRDAINIIGVCQSAQEYLGLGIVVGKSGFGKTHTLKYYAKMPRVAYVECDDTMGQRDLVKAIERSVGIPSGYGSIWERVNGIREFFNLNRGYLLIVDEADKLVSKYTQKKMEILRGIFDQADVGLVIAGEPKLEGLIKGYLSRFANRVDFYTTLKGLSKQEVAKYLTSFDFDDQAINEMVVRATNTQTGCFRLLDRTLNNIMRVSGGSAVTSDTIAKASNMMML